MRILATALTGLALTAVSALAQTPAPAPAAPPAPPPFATTKVEGTDNVYIFRNGNHQSMFIVTPEGVIATDPVAYGRPTGGQPYVDEIRKITQAPIRYLIYSHHHFDHIAGGKAFKDAGAIVVAHKRAKERLAALNDPHTVLPDETVDDKRTITLGGTTLELSYHGLNHSDSTLVMRLPREKIIFVVDTIPVGQIPGARHDRLPPGRDRGLHQAGDRDGLGAHDPRPPRPRRPPRHQAGRAGHAATPAGRLRRDEGAGAGRQVLGHRRERIQAARSTRAGPATRTACRSSPRRYCGLWGRGT